ncbi:MAG TPA: hypothetical protein VFY68_11305 [Nitrososphaeraceae archaeon]|nr:hypothetical protein [Nitrososphaeraceae archaeon]
MALIIATTTAAIGIMTQRLGSTEILGGGGCCCTAFTILNYGMNQV